MRAITESSCIDEYALRLVKSLTEGLAQKRGERRVDFTMSILALDPGTKRIGVAVSDDTGTLALPLEFISAEPFAAFLQRLEKIIDERKVREILIGVPRNMDGSYGPAAEKSREFIAKIQAITAVPVQGRDERLTSVQANRMLMEAGMRGEKRRLRADQSAAAILLQSYLDGAQPPSPS